MIAVNLFLSWACFFGLRCPVLGWLFLAGAVGHVLARLGFGEKR